MDHDQPCVLSIKGVRSLYAGLASIHVCLEASYVASYLTALCTI